MKKIQIKGKDYITVNERLIHFRTDAAFKNWTIEETLVKVDNDEGIFKISIKNPEGTVMASAHAHEKRDSSHINQTSFLENGFTSALGRALGYLGIGIDTSIASAEEVVNAIHQQQNDQWLTEAQLQKVLKGTKEQAQKVLSMYKMKRQYREVITSKFNF